MLDHYIRGAGYQPFVTTNLASGRFAPGDDFNFPYKFRHGSILPISVEEYQRLEAVYSKN